MMKLYMYSHYGKGENGNLFTSLSDYIWYILALLGNSGVASLSTKGHIPIYTTFTPYNIHNSGQVNIQYSRHDKDLIGK